MVTTTLEEKVSVFSTKEDDIKSVCKTPEERARLSKLLDEAEEQSKRKEIFRTKRPRNFLKYLILWKIRFHYGIHWNKPLYPFRLLRNVLLGKFYNMFGIKKHVLRGLEFAGTYKCNFTCNHCLCSRIDETSTRREMSPEDYRRVTKEAMELGATTFGLEGGEPFVTKEWDKIIEACQPKYNHVIISTNGYLFDEKKAKRCAELGVDTINFSLDSGIPELHDAFRRKRGSFDLVVKGIKLCKKYKIKVIINTVVHKGNIYTDGFRKLLEFADKEKVLVNTLLAKGVGSFKDKDVMLSKEDLQAYEKIIEPYFYVQRHLNYNYGKQFGCPGTKEMINFTPYGDVMNCANMHVYFGNVCEEPLGVIRDRALKETPFGRYHSCFLADDPDFMEIYYNKLNKKGYLSIAELNTAIKEYEDTNDKIVYPELHVLNN